MADEAIKETQQQTKQPTQKRNFDGNLLYTENLGFIPGALHGGNQDPRYVFCKFRKDYKSFNYSNGYVLEYLEGINLLQYLKLLQKSKPNKSIDMFRTEDAADFFVNKHKEVRAKTASICEKSKENIESGGKGCAS